MTSLLCKQLVCTGIDTDGEGDIPPPPQLMFGSQKKASALFVHPLAKNPALMHNTSTRTLMHW